MPASPAARSRCPWAVGCTPSQKRYESGSLQVETSLADLMLVSGGSVTRQLLVTFMPLFKELETARE